MIKYTLKCSDGHAFESWFKSSEAFDRLSAAGAITCPTCNSTDVAKSIMAPNVATARKRADLPVSPEPVPHVSAPAATPAMSMLQKLREHLRTNSDYVGKDFAAEARRIHDGESDERAIWGEATADDAKALIDDGIPVAPLPPAVRQDD